MVSFQEIKPDVGAYTFVEGLFLSAFPDEERRPESDQRENIANNPLVHCLLVSDAQGALLGFLTYWYFPEFTYVEHFAIASQARNQGFGGKVVAQFLKMQQRPVVLEAELPDANAMAARRLGFYKRHGFVPLPQAYVQPAYPGRGTAVVPMVLLLSTPVGAVAPSFQTIKSTLYRSVYSCQS